MANRNLHDTTVKEAISVSREVEEVGVVGNNMIHAVMPVRERLPCTQRLVRRKEKHLRETVGRLVTQTKTHALLTADNAGPSAN